jgi:hypothetical protein
MAWMDFLLAVLENNSRVQMTLSKSQLEMNLNVPKPNLNILLRFAKLRTSRLKFDKPYDLVYDNRIGHDNPPYNKSWACFAGCTSRTTGHRGHTGAYTGGWMVAADWQGFFGADLLRVYEGQIC